jgi:hypothetical protein
MLWGPVQDVPISVNAVIGLHAHAGSNVTKPACPLVNGTAVPAIRPVAVPQITSLRGGQIMIGVNNTVPTQIKARAYHALACICHHGHNDDVMMQSALLITSK